MSRLPVLHQTKQIAIPDKPAKIGPFLGLRVEEEAAAPSRRGRLLEGRGRWSLLPARPRLAVCVEFRLSALRVIIPGREGYERDLLKSLGEDIPDQVWWSLHETRYLKHLIPFLGLLY